MSFVYDETLKKVVTLFGEDAVRIVEVFKGVNEITDNEIMEQTEIRINLIRKALYRLYDHSLVGLRRTRDKETGWFVFHWRLQPDQFAGFITNHKRRVLEKLETRLEYEKMKEFYSCQTPGCKRFAFEEAFDLLFKCPTCNNLMVHVDNDYVIDAIAQIIKQIKKELSE